MSWIVPEEYVYATLRAGLTRIGAEITGGTLAVFLERMYGNLTPAQRAQLLTYLSNNDVKLIHGYPHEDIQMPVWAIIVDPEENTFQYVGNVTGSEVELAGGENVPVEGERWQSTIGIVVYDEHQDVARWLYQLVKFFLSKDRRNLADHFPHGQFLSGRDLRPETLGGRLTYRRVCSLRAEYDQEDTSTDDVADEIIEQLAIITATDALGE